jgi:hypothetical protein
MFTFCIGGRNAVVDERGRSEPEGLALEPPIADDDKTVLSRATKLIIAVAEASLEAHLEAGTPDELDALIRKTAGTALTVSRIRQAKWPEEKVQRQKEDEERRTQTQEKRDAL